MLNKISINSRMLTLIIIPAIVLLIIGYVSYAAITENKATSQTILGHTKTLIHAQIIGQKVNEEYFDLLSNINSGNVAWKTAYLATKKAIDDIEVVHKLFDEEVNQYLSPEEKEYFEINQLSERYNLFINSYKTLQPIFSERETKENREILSTYIQEEMHTLSNLLVSRLNELANRNMTSANEKTEASIKDADVWITIFLAAIFSGILISLVLGKVILSSISVPTRKLTNVVHRLSKGEFDARADIKGSDEFAELGEALNTLLDDRAITLSKTEDEHQELNQSVFKLLKAVAELSERNLTVRAAVTEDATGPVADALNLLAEETSATLIQVRNVASEVNETSKKVNTHLMTVNKLAMKEREQAVETAEQVDDMLIRLDGIANSAAETNIMAGNTVASTNKAHKSVTQTLTGMSEIRDTVQETGKRIKQLGERSQEISHVIDIINTIAERTTVLALNASMQAATAGDAGRGFSVIAEEIQRLSESSRESTSQIATLVRNIQQETNTTIATMDKTIEQVIDGSTRAEDAAIQMKEVLETTSQLVESVDKIALVSREQVGISEGLKHKAQSILKSTQSTGQELLSLTGLSRNMGDYAQQLVHSVNVFKLDEKNEKNIAKSEAET